MEQTNSFHSRTSTFVSSLFSVGLRTDIPMSMGNAICHLLSYFCMYVHVYELTNYCEFFKLTLDFNITAVSVWSFVAQFYN